MKQNDNHSYLTKKYELKDTIGGRNVLMQNFKRAYFPPLGLPVDRKCGVWLRNESFDALCAICQKESDQCFPYRVDGLGEALVCEKCHSVFQAPIVSDEMLEEVKSFVKTVETLVRDERKLVPENPKITQKVIEFAYLVDGERLTEQFSNDSRQIARLFQLVKDNKASQGQRKKAVAFAMNVASLFGYESFNKSEE
ncbi:hypothetical protein P6Z29_12520 [Enterococcus faecium]|uniref:hypothetical protein n=1 Tax=Enterococcus faecium TaxID=1352 RepID=UPI00280FF724|nr:hypothetical protein [Enterococcus faecium]MDQ8269961.1 hypothetical protein [Enterococcus faecium]MDT2363446.1 hypothetical protein [Enterococcus faecium]